MKIKKRIGHYIVVFTTILMVLTVATGCDGKTNTNGTYAKQTTSSTVVTTKFTCSGTHVKTAHNRVAFDVANGKTVSVNTSESDLYLYLDGIDNCRVNFAGTTCKKSTTGDIKTGDKITINNAKIVMGKNITQTCTVYVTITSLKSGNYAATVTYE